MNECPTCRLDFSDVADFDAHRVGEHEFTFAEGCRMDPPRYDGRRCLAQTEMEDAHWRRDRWGRWTAPPELQPHLVERVEL